MAKNLYDVTTNGLTKKLDSLTLQCLELKIITPIERNGVKAEPYVEAGVEVCRAQGAYSRCRFNVKLPLHPLPFDEDFFNDDEYLIEFQEFQTTFINGMTKNIFFRAQGYTILNIETGEKLYTFTGGSQ
jgi:hypothetical protein